MKHESQSGAAEREWQAQEQAILQEREGLPAAGDARALQYRLLARALREPVPVALPADFARQVALRALRERGMDGALEGQLLRVTLAVFGLLGLLSLHAHGSDWLLHLQALAPGWSGSAGWLGLLLACVGTNWLVGRRRLYSRLP